MYPLPRNHSKPVKASLDCDQGVYIAHPIRFDYAYNGSTVLLVCGDGNIYYSTAQEAMQASYTAGPSLNASNVVYRPAITVAHDGFYIYYLHQDGWVHKAIFDSASKSIVDDRQLLVTPNTTNPVGIAATYNHWYVLEYIQHRFRLWTDGVANWLDLMPVKLDYQTKQLLTFIDAFGDYVVFSPGSTSSYIVSYKNGMLGTPKRLLNSDYKLYGAATLLVPFTSQDGAQATVVLSAPSYNVNYTPIHSTVIGSFTDEGYISAPMRSLAGTSAYVGFPLRFSSSGTRTEAILHPKYTVSDSVPDSFSFGPLCVQNMQFSKVLSLQPSVWKFVLDASDTGYTPQLGDTVEIRSGSDIVDTAVIVSVERDSVLGDEDVQIVAQNALGVLGRHANMFDTIYGANLCRKSYDHQELPFGVQQGYWVVSDSGSTFTRDTSNYSDNETGILLLRYMPPDKGTQVTVRFRKHNADSLAVYFGNDDYVKFDFVSNKVITKDGAYQSFVFSDNTDYTVRVRYNGYMGWDIDDSVHFVDEDYSGTPFTDAYTVTLEAKAAANGATVSITGIDVYSLEQEETITTFVERVAAFAGVTARMQHKKGSTITLNGQYAITIEGLSVNDSISFSTDSGDSYSVALGATALEIKDGSGTVLDSFSYPHGSFSGGDMRVVAVDAGAAITVNGLVVGVTRYLAVQNALYTTISSPTNIYAETFPVSYGSFVWDVAQSALDAIANALKSIEVQVRVGPDGTLRIARDTPYLEELSEYEVGGYCLEGPQIGHYANQLASAVIMYCADCWVSYRGNELVASAGGIAAVKGQAPYAVGGHECAVYAKRFMDSIQSRYHTIIYRRQDWDMALEPGDVIQYDGDRYIIEKIVGNNMVLEQVAGFRLVTGHTAARYNEGDEYDSGVIYGDGTSTTYELVYR